MYFMSFVLITLLPLESTSLTTVGFTLTTTYFFISEVDLTATTYFVTELSITTT